MHICRNCDHGRGFHQTGKCRRIDDMKECPCVIYLDYEYMPDNDIQYACISGMSPLSPLITDTEYYVPDKPELDPIIKREIIKIPPDSCRHHHHHHIDTECPYDEHYL